MVGINFETLSQPVQTGKLLKNTIRNTHSDRPSNKSLFPKPHHSTDKAAYLRAYILSLLENLYGVEQSPHFHPEGDALYHSLQVLHCAHADTDDPELLAAALLHDVGKAIDYPNHDAVGADSLEGLLSPRIVWLIRHHLDLLVSPKITRKRLAGSQLLKNNYSLSSSDYAFKCLL